MIDEDIFRSVKSAYDYLMEVDPGLAESDDLFLATEIIGMISLRYEKVPNELIPYVRISRNKYTIDQIRKRELERQNRYTISPNRYIVSPTSNSANATIGTLSNEFIFGRRR